jgi:hypothetical protein
MSSLDLADPGEFREALERIRNENDPTDWVLLSYRDKKIVVASFGEGGLKAFSSHLKDDEVHFGVLSFLIEGDGDEYKTAKNILITWLGPDLPGGLMKARAAAHRKQLRDFIQETVTVACEMQASTLDELNEDMVGQAISRTRGGLYATARSVGAVKQQASNKGGSALGGASSRLQMADQVASDEALKYVAGNKNAWAIFAYSKAKKDELEHVKTGQGGLEALVEEWPPSDRVYYCYSSISFTPDAGVEQTKYVLITLVGDEVTPIARARTSGQRKEFIDYIKAICPYHTEFQPNDKEQLKVSEIIVKFK